MRVTMKKWIFRVLRAAKWLAVGIAVLAVLVVSCWYFLPDETLLPGATALLNKKPPVPLDNNAFYPLLGLTASPTLNPTEVGQHAAKMLESAFQDGRLTAKSDLDSLLGSDPFKRRSPQTSYCRKASETPSCVDAYLSHRVAIEAQLQSAAVFIQRYRTLRMLPYYEESTVSLLDTYDLGALFEIAELVDAKIALDMVNPALREAALGELHLEILFTQRILRQSEFLLTQQVYLGLLRKKYRLMAELLARYPEIARAHSRVVADITQPLKPADAQLMRVMEGEFRLGAKAENTNRIMFAQAAGKPDATAAGNWWRSTTWRLLYKPNATINMLYRARMKDGDFYSLSAAAILSTLVKKAGQPVQRDFVFHPLDPRWILYNPMGKVTASVIGQSQFQPYSDRLNDVLAYSRSLELQRQIAVGRIPPDQIADFLAKANPGLADPYTEKPMQYDAARHTLTFTAESPRTVETGTDTILLVKM